MKGEFLFSLFTVHLSHWTHNKRPLTFRFRGLCFSNLQTLSYLFYNHSFENSINSAVLLATFQRVIAGNRSARSITNSFDTVCIDPELFNHITTFSPVRSWRCACIFNGVYILRILKLLQIFLYQCFDEIQNYAVFL